MGSRRDSRLLMQRRKRRPRIMKTRHSRTPFLDACTPRCDVTSAVVARDILEGERLAESFGAGPTYPRNSVVS